MVDPLREEAGMQDISASRFVDVDGGIDGNRGADRVDRSGLALIAVSGNIGSIQEPRRA